MKELKWIEIITNSYDLVYSVYISEVPGGIILKESSTTKMAMVFIPGAKLSDFPRK